MHVFTSRLAVGSEYGTGSEEDTLWVLATVALGSALPWKTEHLGASWKGSLPSCPGARWPRATTSSEPPDQHRPDGALANLRQADKTSPTPLRGFVWLSDHLSWKVFIVCVCGGCLWGGYVLEYKWA